MNINYRPNADRITRGRMCINVPSALSAQLSQPDVPLVPPSFDPVPQCESDLGIQETVEEGHGEALEVKRQLGTHLVITWSLSD